MDRRGSQPPAELWLFVLIGSFLVALTTPLNLLMQLFCWSLIHEIAGSYAADNNKGFRFLLAVAANVGLFLVLCGIAHLAFRRSTVKRRRIMIVVAFVLHVGIWLGLSVAMIMSMAANNTWL